MTAQMAGCLAKLQRAEHHLTVLNAEIAGFEAHHPIKVTVECDIANRVYIFRAWDIVKPDGGWSLLLGDCVHNARSALDHLAYQLAILHLGRDLDEKEARTISFPVARDAKEFISNVRRIKDLLRPVDLTRMEQLQPYQGWNESIWGPDLPPPGPPAPISSYLGQLTELDNADKHRIVQPVWRSPAISRHPQGARELGITGAGTTNDPLEEGSEIGRWFFDREPPDPALVTDASIYYLVHVSLRSPHFATRAGRILGNCTTAVRLVLEMFEPCISQQANPLPLRYWDKEGFDL